MNDKVEWFNIILPKDVLLGMIDDYEYWSRQLQSVVNSNDDMAHMLRYENIAESLKSQMRKD